MPRAKQYTTQAEKQKAYRARKRNALVLQNAVGISELDRPPLRYYGGKWKLAEWIIAQFPDHDCYVEPFAGGASVLFQKPISTHEVINDLDGDVVNFFRVLRECPSDLVRAIELTPYSRQEHTESFIPINDPVERARRFFVRCWQSFGAPNMAKATNTGWRFQKSNAGSASAVRSFNDTDHLWAAAHRLKQVQIECADAFKVIGRFDTARTLFYVDPPYLHETRTEKQGYQYELTDDQHRALAGLLNEVKGMVVLSGYASPLYADLYTGWRRITKTAKDLRGGEQLECLWLSPTTVAAMDRAVPRMFA